MINRFEYTNNFSLILELTVLHNYFESNKLGTYDLIPTTETNDLIRNYNLLVRKKENKFFILKNNESNLGSPVFKGNVILNFVMKFKDSLFLNITDIPFQYKQKFILTSINSEAGKLHQGYYAGASIIQPYDENGIVAEINFKINGKPNVILAKTTKGKGVSFMEGHGQWHHKIPNLEEQKILFRELK